LQSRRSVFLLQLSQSPVSKIICHPDRSAAEWRDLLFV
jgi:hypothetical protein